jgi:hypothetical protein
MIQSRPWAVSCCGVWQRSLLPPCPPKIGPTVVPVSANVWVAAGFALRPGMGKNLGEGLAAPGVVRHPQCDWRTDLFAISLVGRRHGQRQQASARADGDVNLRPLAPLGSVVAGPRSRLRHRSDHLDRSTRPPPVCRPVLKRFRRMSTRTIWMGLGIGIAAGDLSIGELA